MDSKELLNKFYTAFQNADAETMASCYHEEVVFEDPAFGELKGKRAGDMWKMLMSRPGAGSEITYKIIHVDANKGEVKWEAKYNFGKAKRKVHNKITARFKFQDGLIIDHRDKFNFWKWSRMALGGLGIFMGWTPFFRKRISTTVNKALDKFSEN